MTALQHNPSLSSSVPGLVLSVCSTLLYGCLGGAGGGPNLGWQDQDTVTLTVADDDAPPERGSAGSGADPNVADAGTSDEALDDSEQPKQKPKIEHRTTSDDSVRCGDKHLDDDEICDIAIPDGEDGACATDCGTDPCAMLDVHGCMTTCIDNTTNPKCPYYEPTDAGTP